MNASAAARALAGSLLLAGAFPFPDQYYLLLKVTVFSIAVWQILLCLESRHLVWAVGMGAVAYFYNPFYPPEYHFRDWQILNVAFGALLWMSLPVLDIGDKRSFF